MFIVEDNNSDESILKPPLNKRIKYRHIQHSWDTFKISKFTQRGKNVMQSWAEQEKNTPFLIKIQLD